MRASSIWSCCGRALDCRRYSRICACGRRAAIRRWRPTCRIDADDGEATSIEIRVAHARSERDDDAGLEARHGVAAGIQRRRAHSLQRHVTPCVVRTAFGDYLQAFRLGGASFESADDAQLNNWHERLNVLWRNIASPNVALWTHVIRRRAEVSVPEHAPAPQSRAAAALPAAARALRTRLARETLMVNELYLSVLYRPMTGMAPACCRARLPRRSATGARVELADSLDACDKLSQTLAASLARYEPEKLGATATGGSGIPRCSSTSDSWSTANRSACRCRADP